MIIRVRQRSFGLLPRTRARVWTPSLVDTVPSRYCNRDPGRMEIIPRSTGYSAYRNDVHFAVYTP